MVSIVGVIGVTLGIGISYLTRMYAGKLKFAKADGYLYCIVAWFAVFAARQLNVAVFPEDTFPIELTPSSWLLWMTILGSFFAWRDGTLIFQSIPALALFGFVGCYDTFKAVVFLFFLFLICFATLFARAHGRDMQDRAIQSGFFSLGRGFQMNPSEQSIALREGPWRWAAGAEWALWSALAIVGLSIVGAPVIQATAKPLSGFVSIRAPKLRTNTPPSNNQAIPTVSKVGTGPVRLSDTPYFEVSGNVPLYLRTGIFNYWNGSEWAITDTKGPNLFDRISGKVVGETPPDLANRLRLPNKKPSQFSDEYHSLILNVRSLFPTREVPQAGNDPSFQGSNDNDKSEYGITLRVPNKYEAKVLYDSVDQPTKLSKVPAKLDSRLFSYTSTDSIDQEVVSLAKTISRGISSDFEKAEAIKEEISKQIKYNTNSSPTPDGRDPVQFALFESHQGYCDLFASSMVQMARSVKIPARYVIGYLPDSKNMNSSGTQLLLESDRHAWAELYFEDIGWVVFDATEGAEVVPGGGRKENKPTDYNGILRIIGLGINVLIVLAVIVGIGAFIRIRNLPKSSKAIRSELDSEYVAFIGMIWKFTGQRRLLSETTSEYLARVSDQLGELGDHAKKIGIEFTNLMFGPSEISLPDVLATRESVQNFKGLLSKMQKSR